MELLRKNPLGNVQLRIFEYLAPHTDSLMKPTAKAIGKDAKNTNDSFHALEEKGPVTLGSKSERLRKANMKD